MRKRENSDKSRRTKDIAHEMSKRSSYVREEKSRNTSSAGHQR